MIFQAAKEKIQRKQTKAHNKPDLNYHFAILEIANLCPYLLPTRKSEKKRKKSHIFLPKYFADTEHCRIFAVHLRNTDAYLRHRNPLYHNASFFDLFTFSAIKSILYICALVSYHITYYV